MNTIFEGWVNIDIEKSPGVLQHDLRQGLPFENGTASLIYSEHFIEHLTYEDGIKLLSECLRVLKPGGHLRTVCPDLKQLCIPYAQASLPKWRSGMFDTRSNAHLINQCMRDWGHLFVYDFDCLSQALKSVGFTQIIEGRFSGVPELELPNPTRQYLIDMVVDCKKGN